MKLYFVDGRTLVFREGNLLVEVPSPAMEGNAVAAFARRTAKEKRKRPIPILPPGQPASPTPLSDPDWRDFPAPKTGGPGNMIIRPIGDAHPEEWGDTVLHLTTDFSELSWQNPHDLVTKLLASTGHNAASAAHAYTLLDVHIPPEELEKGLNPGQFASLFEPGGVGLNAVRLLWDTDSNET